MAWMIRCRATAMSRSRLRPAAAHWPGRSARRPGRGSAWCRRAGEGAAAVWRAESAITRARGRSHRPDRQRGRRGYRLCHGRVLQARRRTPRDPDPPHRQVARSISPGRRDRRPRCGRRSLAGAGTGDWPLAKLDPNAQAASVSSHRGPRLVARSLPHRAGAPDPKSTASPQVFPVARAATLSRFDLLIPFRPHDRRPRLIFE